MAKAAAPKKLPDVAALAKAQARVEHMRLALELERHDRAYYQEDAPKISDAEYDALRLRFNAIEKRFPEFVSSESPSQKVGAAPSGKFRKVHHAVPMLSLDNAFTEEDLRAFDRRIHERLNVSGDLDYVAEPKLDGLAVTVIYREGLLAHAATRGDTGAFPMSTSVSRDARRRTATSSVEGFAIDPMLVAAPQPCAGSMVGAAAPASKRLSAASTPRSAWTESRAC